MSDRAAFLRAIRARPDDDTPRLVFADWLDERGDPLGEFIRVQLELDPARYEIDRPRVRELLDREAELLAAHRAEWLGPAAELDGGDRRLGPVFARGLPDRLVLSLVELTLHGKLLLDALPTVREVAVYEVQGEGALLAACPHLDRLETLEIADWPTAEDAAELTRSPHFGGQSVLRLWDAEAGNGGSLLDHLDPAAWRPRGRVELVQLFGGVASAYRLALANPDRAADRLADRLNAVWGPATVRVVRPFRWIFPLWADGHGLRTGHRRGRALLVVDLGDVVAVASFTPNGQLLGSWRQSRPAGVPFDDWLARPERDFRPGPIRVGEFAAETGVRLSQWSRRDAEVLLHPQLRPEWMTDGEWHDRGRQLKRWMDDGRCLLTARGRVFLVDGTGRVEPA